VRNVPVVHITMDNGEPDRDRTAAEIRDGLEEIDLDNVPGITIAFTWRGDPEHSRLSAAAEAIAGGLQPVQERIKLLLLAIDGDIGKTFGRLMHRELNWPGKIICLDGVELHELDYIDVGELIAPPGVVPVVIKSLLFA
jgi:ethanolamine utilization protein EutA